MDIKTLLAFASTSGKITSIINDIKAAIGQIDCNVGIQKEADGLVGINIVIAPITPNGIPDIVREIAAVIDCAQQAQDLAMIFTKVKIRVKLISGKELLLVENGNVKLLE
jgi:hypothetical protein